MRGVVQEDILLRSEAGTKGRLARELMMRSLGTQSLLGGGEAGKWGGGF